MYPDFYLYLVALMAAELLFFIVRSKAIILMAKKEQQLTDKERDRLRLGLAREVFLEAFLFVPASATLLFLILPLFITINTTLPPQKATALYAMIGVSSYGFPFTTLKAVVTRIALNTLKEFASITRSQSSGE